MPGRRCRGMTKEETAWFAYWQEAARAAEAFRAKMEKAIAEYEQEVDLARAVYEQEEARAQKDT